VVEHSDDPLRQKVSGSVEITDQLLLLGVHTQNRVVRGSSPPGAGRCLCTSFVRPFFTDPLAKSVGEVVQIVLALADGLGITAQPDGERGSPANSQAWQPQWPHTAFGSSPRASRGTAASSARSRNWTSWSGIRCVVVGVLATVMRTRKRQRSERRPQQKSPTRLGIRFGRKLSSRSPPESGVGFMTFKLYETQFNIMLSIKHRMVQADWARTPQGGASRSDYSDVREHESSLQV
jgi:hypothetical protein